MTVVVHRTHWQTPPGGYPVGGPNPSRPGPRPNASPARAQLRPIRVVAPGHLTDWKVIMDPTPDYDASDELEFFFDAFAWGLRGVYPPPAYPSN